MKAVAITSPGVVEVVDDVPMPPVQDHECLVKILACGLCNGTDLKIIDNHLSAMEIQYPTLLGHESVGEVVKVGRKVKYVKVGDRFTNPAGRVADGTRYYRNWACDMEYGVVQDQRLMREEGIDEPLHGATCPMPREIDPVGATVLLTLKEMCSALENFGLETGMDVLIYGDGPVGLALAQFARLQGADTVAVVGHHDDRLERIKRVGKANTVINSHDQSVVETLGNQRFDLAVDAAGRIDVIREAASLLNPRGKVGVTGVLSPEESTLRLTDLPNNIAVQMLNWPYGEHAIHNRVVEYVTSGRIDLSDYYSHVLPLEEAARAVEMLRNREAWRIALRP